MTEPDISKPRILATTCTNNTCPTVFELDGDNVVVQGYVDHRKTPDGEQAVQVPTQLLRDAIRMLDKA
jgi:hypothetical protein